MHIALFLFLTFADAFERFVPMANYWDELAACLVVCWGFYSYLRSRELGKGELSNWIWLIALVLIGAVSSVFHWGLQESYAAIVKDVVALCKVPAIFFVLERRAVKAEKQERIIADIAKVSRWIIVITLFAVGIGYFMDLGFYSKTENVRIVPIFEFVFSHSTFFISSYVMITAALIAESMKKNRLFLLLNCGLIFMAQRSKGYIFIAFILLFVLIGETWLTKILDGIFGTKKGDVKLGRLVLAAAVMAVMILIVGKSRIQEILGYDFLVARTALYIVGVKILIDFFPLGSGFGTFASYLSGEYYSNIYAMYGVDDVWGMSRYEYMFISDVFWPYIYGQFGVFGLLIYVKLIFLIFIRQFHSGIGDNSRIAVAAVWIYALIASTSEAYFTNGTGVQMALFLGLLIDYADRKGIAKRL